MLFRSYKLTSDGASIGEVFGLKQDDSSDAERGYYQYWKCTINGEDSSEGRQSVTKIYDNDEIVFTWTEGSQGRRDTTAADADTTDPSADTTCLLYTSRLIDVGRALEGMPRHASTHAAGVVITQNPLTQYVPLAVNNLSLIHI